MSNVIKLAAKEEAAEGHRIPKEIQKELNRKRGSKSRRRQLRQKKDIEKVSSWSGRGIPYAMPRAF